MSDKKKKIIAVIGGSQPSPEEARLAEEVGRELARQGGIPVIGLNTWALSRNGKPDDSIISAKNPTEAVNKALSLAKNL